MRARAVVAALTAAALLLGGCAQLDVTGAKPVATGSPTPTAPPSAPPTAPATPGPLAFVKISDESNKVAIDVPDSWTDIDRTPFVEGWYSVAASPDLDRFNTTREAPGVLLGAYPGYSDPGTVLAQAGSTADAYCTEKITDAATYDDGTYVGLWSQWTGCDEAEGVFYVVIVASDAAKSMLIMLAAQFVPGWDNDAIFREFQKTFAAQL